MKSLIIKIGKKSKKAFSFPINSQKKNKVLKDYCLFIKKNKKLIICLEEENKNPSVSQYFVTVAKTKG